MRLFQPAEYSNRHALKKAMTLESSKCNRWEELNHYNCSMSDSVATKNCMRIATATLFLLAGGCASYQPQPASPEVIQAVLQPLPLEELQNRAAFLRHPGLPPIQIVPGAPLTPQAAAVVAVIQNPTLRAIRDRRGVAEAQLLQAGLLPNPQLIASNDFQITGPTYDGLSVDPFAVGLSWEVTSLITYEANKLAAKYQLTSVELDIAWLEWQVALGAKLHATRLGWLEAERTLAEAQMLEADVAAKSMDEAVSLGLATSLDRDSNSSVLQRRRTTLLAIENLRNNEEILFRQAIGVPSDAIVHVVESPTPPPLPLTPSIGELASVIEKYRLDLAGLRQGYLSQEEKLRGAVLSQFPKIAIGFNRMRDVGNVGTIGFGVAIDLPVSDWGQGRIANEGATRQTIFDEIVARTFDARSDAALAYKESWSLEPQVREADKQVERLDRLAKVVLQARREGAIDILQVNQILNNLTDARLEALQLRQLEAESRVAIEAATGKLLDGSSL